ncbi:MAG TPA: hypothetical protein VHH10_15885 [Rubrobacteraceae bacterium]|nr:hypothetical protein [Rubrobacteraceae bacterium]
MFAGIRGGETDAGRTKTTDIRDTLLFWRGRRKPGREQAGEASETDEDRFRALAEVVAVHHGVVDVT